MSRRAEASMACETSVLLSCRPGKPPLGQARRSDSACGPDLPVLDGDRLVHRLICSQVPLGSLIRRIEPGPASGAKACRYRGRTSLVAGKGPAAAPVGFLDDLF